MAIAKQLNAERAPAPRPQQGRPCAWAPSSVRAVLYRELYRGEIVWNRTKKRDSWGVKRQRLRPESEWLRVSVPNLRIVSDDLWEAAHARLDATRRSYLRTQGGRLAEDGDTAHGLTRNPVRDNAQAFTATNVQSTHAWYRNHAIEIHSGSSGSRCWARVVLILYETPHTWSALEGWPTDDQWGHTAADAVAAANQRSQGLDRWTG